MAASNTIPILEKTVAIIKCHLRFQNRRQRKMALDEPEHSFRHVLSHLKTLGGKATGFEAMTTGSIKSLSGLLAVTPAPILKSSTFYGRSPFRRAGLRTQRKLSVKICLREGATPSRSCGWNHPRPNAIASKVGSRCTSPKLSRGHHAAVSASASARRLYSHHGARGMLGRVLPWEAFRDDVAQARKDRNQPSSRQITPLHFAPSPCP